MSGLFSSKKTTPSYESVYDPFSGLRGQTSSWLQGQIGKTATPYTGEQVAPMGEEEKRSFDFLRKYTDMPQPEGIGLAKEEVRKTMQGEYDPTTSPYYQAVKAESARNLEDTLSGIKSEAAGGGRYWTGARLGEQREARTDVGNALNKLLGGMAETERARRLETAPFAAQLGEYEQKLPLQQATALQQLGALPRSISQAQNEAIYNEWLRQQNYPIQMAQLAQGYATQQPTLAQAGYQPSAFSALLPGIGQGLGTAASNLLSDWFKKKTPTTG